MCKNYICRKASFSIETKDKYNAMAFLVLIPIAVGMSAVGYFVGLEIIMEQKAAVMAAILFPIITVFACISYMLDANTEAYYEDYFRREGIKSGIIKWLNNQKIKNPSEKDDEFFETVKRFCIAINNINNKTNPKPKKVALTRFDFSKN